MIGLSAVFLALLFRKEKCELSLLIAVAAAVLIFGYVLARIQIITEFLSDLSEKLPIEKNYLTALLKMLGITYASDFISSVCSEAGYGAVGSQIELFAKISIIALAVPELLYLIQMIEDFF